MNVTPIGAAATLIGIQIVTATATTAEAVGAVGVTVEIEIGILMDVTIAIGATDVARRQVEEADDTHPITSIGDAEAIREAPLGEVALPEADGIMMLLPEHPLRPLLPPGLMHRDGEQYRA
jgi:hypothetical protein